MRKPERLDKFYSGLKDIHKTYFCDWRFGQFMSNFFGWVQREKSMDIFFPEEDDMLKYLKEFVEEYSS